MNFRRYFPEGEEGDFLYVCWILNIEKEKALKYLTEEEAAKIRPKPSFEELLKELEQQRD